MPGVYMSEFKIARSRACRARGQGARAVECGAQSRPAVVRYWQYRPRWTPLSLSCQLAAFQLYLVQKPTLIWISEERL